MSGNSGCGDPHMRTICLCRKCFLISKLTFYLFQGYIGKQHFCLGGNYVHNASGMKIDQISVCPEVQFCAQQTFFSIADREIGIGDQAQIRNLLRLAEILDILHTCFFRQSKINHDIIF